MKKPDYEFNFKNEKYVFEIGGKIKLGLNLQILLKNKYILTHPANIIKPYKPLILLVFYEFYNMLFILFHNIIYTNFCFCNWEYYD